MFNLSETIKEKFEALVANFRPQPALVDGESIHKMASCTGCMGTCAGSCRGTCTASCQRYSR